VADSTSALARRQVARLVAHRHRDQRQRRDQRDDREQEDLELEAHGRRAPGRGQAAGGGAEELARARAGAAEREDGLGQGGQQLGEARDLFGLW
jgi:hypothetical protein